MKYLSVSDVLRWGGMWRWKKKKLNQRDFASGGCRSKRGEEGERALCASMTGSPGITLKREKKCREGEASGDD